MINSIPIEAPHTYLPYTTTNKPTNKPTSLTIRRELVVPRGPPDQRAPQHVGVWEAGAGARFGVGIFA
jgi:hypothetical protein